MFLIVCLIVVSILLLSSQGYTPLHLACIHGHDEVIKILVDDYGKDADALDCVVVVVVVVVVVLSPHVARVLSNEKYSQLPPTILAVLKLFC